MPDSTTAVPVTPIFRHCGEHCDEAIQQLVETGLLRVARNDVGSALATPRNYRGSPNEVRPRHLEIARRHQGRFGPAVHAAVLRRDLCRAVGQAGPGQGRSPRPQPFRRAGRTAFECELVFRRRQQRAARISPARPGRRARQGAYRQEGQGGRARPRRVHRRRPDRDWRPRRGGSPGPRVGQAGGGLCRRL